MNAGNSPPVATHLASHVESRWLPFIGALAVVLGALCLRVVNDTSLFDQMVGWKARAESIGRLRNPMGGVRLRPDDGIVWYDLPEKKESGVVEGDTVFTSATGSVDLELTGDFTGHIPPNSLVRVSRRRRAGDENRSWYSRILRPFFGVPADVVPSLSLEKGSIEIQQSRASSEPLELQIQGRTFNVASGTKLPGVLTAEIDPRRPEAAVVFFTGVADQFRIAEFGQSDATMLFPNQIGVAPRAPGAPLSVTRAVYRVLSPVDGAVIHGGNAEDGGQTNVVFSWEWSIERETGDRIALEIEGASTRQIELAPRDHRKTLSMRPGSYRWRISVTRNGQRLDTLWSAFQLAFFEPPRVSGPANDFAFQSGGPDEGAPIHLSWSPVETDFEAEIELTREGRHGKDVLPAQPGGIDLRLPPGDYLWRVRQRSAQQGRTSPWSENHRFLVRHERIKTFEAVSSLLVDSPVVVTPDPAPAPAPSTVTAQAVNEAPSAQPSLSKNRTQNQANGASPLRIVRSSSRVQRTPGDLKAATVTLSLSWSSVPGARLYRVVLFTGDGKTLSRLETRDTHVEVRLEGVDSSGVIQEVTALLPNGSTFVSPRQPSEIALAGPALNQPPPGSSFRVGDRVIMTWERTPLTDGYRVQISKDSRFSELDLDEVAQSNVKIFSPPAAGRYFWRVQSTGRAIRGEWGTPSSFDSR